MGRAMLLPYILTWVVQLLPGNNTDIPLLPCVHCSRHEKMMSDITYSVVVRFTHN